MEYTVPAFEKHKEPSIKEQYRRGAVGSGAEPLSAEEFYDYIKEKKPELIGVILDAGNLLNDLENMSQTETIKRYVADFIVDKVFIVEYSKDRGSNSQQERVYAYYKALLERNQLK